MCRRAYGSTTVLEDCKRIETEGSQIGVEELIGVFRRAVSKSSSRSNTHEPALESAAQTIIARLEEHGVENAAEQLRLVVINRATIAEILGATTA